MFKWLTLIVLIALPSAEIFSAGTDIAEPLAPADEKKVTDLVSFVELLFNTVGGQAASRKEKDVIISETYLKAFAGDQAKIEDDLHPREVIINKDIQNYLRDVDIFFKNVQFDFDVKDIKKLVNKDGGSYFRARVLRKLKGTTFNVEDVQNELERFIEINVNEAKGELKIASIYNVESNNRLTLQQWWKDLSFEWKVIFQRRLRNEISATDATQLFGITELDISYNRYVETLDPLNVLVNLKKLNLSNTTVKDLNPLKGLSNLEELYLSNTTIKDLSMVKELPSLRVISFESTEIGDIEPLMNLPMLEKIVCTNTRLTPEKVKELRKNLPNVEVIAESVTLSKWWKGLSPDWQDVFRAHVDMLKLEPDVQELDQISDIKKIDISGKSGITDLTPLAAIKDLQEFKANKTGITSLTILSQMRSLRKIDISDTYVNSLDPLLNLEKLEHLNVDYTSVPEGESVDFLIDHPNTLVIFNSIKFIPAWLKLSNEWRSFLMEQIDYTGNKNLPVEALFQIINLQELDISDRDEFADMAGLSILPVLTKLNFSKLMSVANLETVAELKALEELDCSYNPIENLGPLSQLTRLKKLNIEYTKVTDLTVLPQLTKLRSVNMSSTRIKNLNELRSLPNLEEIECSNTAINSLSPLITLRNLKKISCFNTKLNDKDIKELKSTLTECKVVFY